MADVEQVVAAIRAGQPAVVPTDTVYGLVASPYSEAPVRRLYRLKGRDDVHIGKLGRTAFERIAVEHDEVGEIPGQELAASSLVAR